MLWFKTKDALIAAQMAEITTLNEERDNLRFGLEEMTRMFLSEQKKRLNAEWEKDREMRDAV